MIVTFNNIIINSLKAHSDFENRSFIESETNIMKNDNDLYISINNMQNQILLRNPNPLRDKEEVKDESPRHLHKFPFKYLI